VVIRTLCSDFCFDVSILSTKHSKQGQNRPSRPTTEPRIGVRQVLSRTKQCHFCCKNIDKICFTAKASKIDKQASPTLE
jgi:hypothetical protein